MRNLICLKHSTLRLESPLPLTGNTWDCASNSLLCTFGPAKENATIELRRLSPESRFDESESQIIASWEAPCPNPDLDVDEVVSLRHLVQNETTCIIFAGGDIVVVRPDPEPEQEKIEIVGSVDAGIAAASWSPDEDLLAIVTKEDNLILMTNLFDGVANVSFSPEDAHLSKHVSVGWGKSETQFKGKRAKALKDPTMPEKDEHGSLSMYDANESSVSWRGDGAYVAVNTLAKSSRRIIRVYSRDGVLDSVSEPVDGLEGALSWRPAGNLIAGIQRLHDECRVVFFERNGLRHGEFGLRVSITDGAWKSPISLEWNIDSTVLAVCYTNRIQLWTMGNHHYYLKQEIRVPKPPANQGALKVGWHPEDALSLSLAGYADPEVREHETSRGLGTKSQPSQLLRSLSYILDVSAGPMTNPHDLGLVLVHDGAILRMTLLRLAMVPPPMALHEIHLPEVVLDSAVDRTNTIFALLHPQSVSVFRSSNKASVSSAIELQFTHELSQDRFRGTPIQVSFDEQDHIYVLFDGEDKTILDVATLELARIHGSTINRLITSVANSGMGLIEDNTITQLLPRAFSPPSMVTDRPGSGDRKLICRFPSVAPAATFLYHEDQAIAVGLSATGVLYANERQLARSCTSFMVTEAHVVFTTSNHLLKFVHLDSPQEMDVTPDAPETDERCRNIERGAKLIAVMPTNFSVVLQMPRGNLETIYPRALVLAGIRRYIEKKDYKSAYLACRNHRVDMNILHDYAPQQFLENVESVIFQLQKVGHIDLLLSQLREEDVAATMYLETLAAKNRTMQTDGDTPQGPISSLQKAQPPQSKVNRICDAFLQVLQTRYATNLQNVITANLCKSPPDIEAGLEVIADLNKSKPDLVEAAVEHICFLADVNKIYDCALGIYDLHLALLIAQQSQKDPREYLPYLQLLQSKTGVERQFHIDDDLSRHVSALRHLHSIANFDRVKAYTQKHELYTAALDLYKYDPSHHAALLHIYATFLSSRNRFKDAAIAFESLGDHAAASEAYRAVNMWHEALSTASQSPSLSEGDIVTLAESLADALDESKDYAASATVRLDYLTDIPGCIGALCRGHNFAEAIRIAVLKRRNHLITDAVDPGLADGFATLTELTKECRDQLHAQVPRIGQLREAKRHDPLNYLDASATALAGEGHDVPDDISLAPSESSTANQTFLTRYTSAGRTGTTLASGTSRKSSKNRRREERKRARGKKGTVYEEEYLVGSVGRLIERVNGTGEEVGRTVEGLCRRGMWERARALESGWSGLVELCQRVVGEVFEVDDAHEEDVGERPDKTQGEDGVPPNSLTGRKTSAPAVRPHIATALLSP